MRQVDLLQLIKKYIEVAEYTQILVRRDTKQIRQNIILTVRITIPTFTSALNATGLEKNLKTQTKEDYVLIVVQPLNEEKC